MHRTTMETNDDAVCAFGKQSASVPMLRIPFPSIITTWMTTMTSHSFTVPYLTNRTYNMWTCNKYQLQSLEMWSEICVV